MFSSAAYVGVGVSPLGTKDIIKLKTHYITWVEVTGSHCATKCFMSEALLFSIYAMHVELSVKSC